MIAIPFSVLPPQLLRVLSRAFFWVGYRLSTKIKNIDLYLDQAEMKISSKEYISMSFTSTLIFFLVFSVLGSLLARKLETNIFIAIGAVIFITLFIFSQQLMYPKLKADRRIKNIERNLIPALQNMLVQLAAGVPLFNVIATIADSDYGGVSEQFRLVVRKINAGRPQIIVLEEIAKNNPSLHFRRTLWQIINGMKTGTDMSDVIKVSIDNLSEEQVIQIQRYGSQLNPLAMFYMMIAVVVPALGVTFIMVLSSFMNLSALGTKLIFWGLLGVVFFFQLMFIGMLKTRRPNLLD
jgi:archaeal flagellar protein FlaJ